ncbi:hypothetical protein GCM10008086_16290 [Salegentibacter mishustinae]|nr:hypothetical protein GCM10008086_16290 [Salegentibacter mishustinae]
MGIKYSIITLSRSNKAVATEAAIRINEVYFKTGDKFCGNLKSSLGKYSENAYIIIAMSRNIKTPAIQ